MRPSRRRSFVAPLVAGALLLSSLAPVAGAEERGPRRIGTDVLARDSWIVTLGPEANAWTDAAALATAAGGRVGHVFRHALNGFQLKGSSAAAQALARNPRVLSVQADAAIYLTDLLPHGVDRVNVWDQAGDQGAYQQGFRGNGARIAVLDTGIDLDHPDLVAGIDAAMGANCVSPGQPPNDGHGHGTHVSGTAAAPYNGVGIVGVAPEARLLPVKVFDDAGNSAESIILCGLDHVIGLNSDTDPANDVDVVNMSFGEQRAWGDCASDPLHAGICAAHAAGIVLVGGVGNSAGDAGGFVPAAYPEVLGVSALADFDGARGGSAGCPFVWEIFWYECDDSFAFFSSSGPSVDLIAPGVQEYSTWAGGAYQTSSGTSMATPHISGIAAIMAAAAPALAPDDARSALLASGECPNGDRADADGTAGCAGQGTWPDDPDGTPEPLGHALWAALAVASPPPPPPPTVVPPSAPSLSAVAGDASVELGWTPPSDDGGGTVTAYEIHRWTAVEPRALLTTAAGDATAYTDSGLANGTAYHYEIAAVNSAGTGAFSNTASATPQATATVASAPQNLTASKVQSGIRLRWMAPATDGGSAITAYRIHRSTTAGAETFLAQVPAGQLQYTDTSVARRTTYFYVVTAVNGVGEGPRSNEVVIKSR